MLKILRKYFFFNLAAGMEYRISFLIQVFGMALNNSAFIFFWLILFNRVGGDIKGYGFEQVMFLWSLASTGYGLTDVFMGNARFISSIIYKGELDVYLLQPRPVLPNLVGSRMSIAGWGDIIYGVILFVLTQELTWGKGGLFILFALLMALVFSSMRVFYHSLTFYLGNSENFAGTITELMITFTIYPGSIFSAPTTWILHSMIPAALVAWIPARIFAHFQWTQLLLVLGADSLVVLAAVILFHQGLKRYASGNRMGTRI